MGNLLSMGGGRPRLPTQTKKQRGTYDKGRNKNPAEPKPPAFTIPEPTDAVAAEERAAWLELREMINPLRTASASDMTAFRQLVDALALQNRAAAEIRTGGLIETGEKMNRKNPAVDAMVQAQKLVWYGLGRFGCTPADRSRVSGAADASGKTDDPEDEFS